MNEISRILREPLDPKLKVMAIAFGFLNISGEGNFDELMENLKEYAK